LSKIRRGGFVFIAWKGDHAPRHVHVFKDGKLIARWDLERGRLMSGRVSRRIVRIIEELSAEGRL